jgi:hypothetical protein
VLPLAPPMAGAAFDIEPRSANLKEVEGLVRDQEMNFGFVS